MSRPAAQDAPSDGHVVRPSRMFDAYVFDLDGTIYLGEGLLPGAHRLITTLRDRGVAVRFLSNNPTKVPEQYAEKLAGLGLPTPVEDIVNTVVATTAWLRTFEPGKVVYPIAEAPLIRAFAEAGIPMSDDPAEIDVVVASYDRTFVYDKLQIAFDAIWFHRRAKLIATNPDRFCPFPGGRGEPDCAAIVAAIEACTGVRCEKTIGKPDPALLEAALVGLDVDAADTVMVGDRLATDIRLARNAGARAALVLTGDSDLDDLAAAPDGDQPHYVLDRVDTLLPPTVWAEQGWEEPAGAA